MLLNGSGQGLRPCLSLGLCLEFGDYNCTEINAEIQQQAAILLVDDNAINLSKMVDGGVPYFNELFKRKTGDRLQRLQTKENPEQRLG